MSDAVKAFPSQFAYEPKLENAKKIRQYKQYILLGMGGSHLAADILQTVRPELSLTIHSDYGLPAMTNAVLKQSLIIASSYSGNTEEVINGMKIAKKKNMAIVCIAVGGTLIDLAKKLHLPYIQIGRASCRERV